MATAQDTLLTVVRMEGAQNYQRDLAGIEGGMGRVARREEELIRGTERLSNVFFGAGAAATALGGYALKTAADFEVLRAKMDVAFGDRGSEMFDWAVQFAASTPFEVQGIVDVTAQLELLGLEATKWLPKIGDMAGAMGTDVKHAANAVAKATMGQMESLRESYGVSNQALAEYGANVDSVGRLVRATTEDQQAMNEALFAFMSDKFSGGMAKRMDTLQGKFSNLKDAIEQTAAEIGEEFLPAAKETVETVEGWVAAYRDLSPVQKQIITDLIKFGAVGGMIGGVTLKLTAMLLQYRLTQSVIAQQTAATAAYTASLNAEAAAAGRAAAANAGLAGARGSAAGAAGAGMQVTGITGASNMLFGQSITSVLVPMLPYIAAAVAGVAIPYYVSGVGGARKQAENARAGFEGMVTAAAGRGYIDQWYDPFTGAWYDMDETPRPQTEGQWEDWAGANVGARRGARRERGYPTQWESNAGESGYNWFQEGVKFRLSPEARAAQERAETAEAMVEEREATEDTIKALKARQQYEATTNASLAQRQRTEEELREALLRQAAAAWKAGDMAGYWSSKAEAAGLAMENTIDRIEQAGVLGDYIGALEATGASQATIQRARREQAQALAQAANEALRQGDIQGYYGAITERARIMQEGGGAAGALGRSAGGGALMPRGGVLSPEQFAERAVMNNIEISQELTAYIQMPDGAWREANARVERGRDRRLYHEAQA